MSNDGFVHMTFIIMEIILMFDNATQNILTKQSNNYTIEKTFIFPE